jgi:hypothetical protein
MIHPSSRPVDLDAVAQLVEQLERDLSRARTGGGSVETLRAEVEQLRAALAAETPSQFDVQHGLTSVRTRLQEFGDELETDALIGADYLRRIGRLLGLG